MQLVQRSYSQSIHETIEKAGALPHSSHPTPSELLISFETKSFLHLGQEGMKASYLSKQL